MEQQLVCPNCHAENLPGAMSCYRCNSKMPTAPAWAGPAPFKVYDYTKDRGRAYYFSIVGAVLVAICYFLTWIGVPKAAQDANNKGTSALDILLGSAGSKGAIGQGGVGDGSVGIDVRMVLLVVLLAALASLAVAIIKPMFLPLLACGLIVLAGSVYFLLQLIVRNNAQFNTPDLIGLLGLGFYGTLVAGVCILGSSFFYRPVPMMMTKTN